MVSANGDIGIMLWCSIAGLVFYLTWWLVTRNDNKRQDEEARL